MMDSQLILHLLLCTLPCVVWSYNFDGSVPTIIDSGIGSSYGFGFSMTQHEFSDGRKVALVSSPRINGSDLFGDPVESEGGVFLCPFDNTQTCQPEPVFQTKKDGNPLAEQLFSVLSTDTRSYDGQLLGYSLRSFDTHVVACAPLYVSTIQILTIDGENYGHATPTGRCVVLNRDLSDSIESILQITNNDLEGSPMTMGGVDIDIINMDIGGGISQRIAIGSVFGGSLGGNSPGQVIVTSLDPATLGDTNTTADTGDSSTPVTSLLGYKIELGRFTEDVIQIASSAPRANMHLGQIKIFNVPVDGVLSEQWTIDGPEPDGYFGYDFVAHSFSEDGHYHSLVVGCPLCDNDRGSAFLYLHSGDPSVPFSSSPVHIPSPDSSVPGQFGMAVSVIGDSDGDGILDVAISAPYAGSGGVVYICRGFRGGILPPVQAISASPLSTAFGYTLSGGLDIDNNGYPDMTVGDLSGSVTTVRASPLVTVVMEFDDLQTTVDLVDDRKCRINDDITLLCFAVTPCFYYEPLHSMDVPEFAFQYHLTVDGDHSIPRVILLSKSSSDETYTITTENAVSDNITMSGAGKENRMCVGSFTFAIRADFAETVPIPVRLEVSESDAVPPLPSDLTTPTLGGPLTPVLRRYIEGDRPVVMAITQDVQFGFNCNGGSGPECEPTYTITSSPTFDDNEPLLLSSGVSFSYDITIENTAGDDGLSPILVLDLPNGILLNTTVSNTEGAVTICESSGSVQPQCLLQNPIHSNSTLSLTMSFRFNTTAISLTTTSLSLTLSVVDGPTGDIIASVTSNISLRAEASFGLGIIVSEDEYQASRHALSQNIRVIPLNETGPIVRFSVLVSNSRDSSNGTTIPTSTLVIHIPVAVQLDRNSDLQPLLIPYQLISASDTINCRYHDANVLSPVQQPTNFVPLGVGVPPESSLRECEGQRGELGVRCGSMVCSVRDLEAGSPPAQVTVFAYLFSPSIIVRESLSIYAGINTTVEGLVITDTEDDFSSVSFGVLPAVIEVSLECFQYWIIAVSVVAGLLVLLILISALACCGVFGRWYKRRGEESIGASTESVDATPSRTSSTFTLRTVPPLPGMVSGGSVRSVREEEEVKVDMSKDEEAELERQLEADIMAPAASHPQLSSDPQLASDPQPSAIEPAAGAESVGDIDIPLEQFTFDSHVGVSNEGDETEI